MVKMGWEGWDAKLVCGSSARYVWRGGIEAEGGARMGVEASKVGGERESFGGVAAHDNGMELN